MSRYWFTPRPDYDGPPIELTTGRHDRNGKFHPKHVSLTGGPSRLNRSPYRRRNFKMIGDPSTDVHEIYAMHMAEKRGRRL
jgi:hypothetical protein